MSSSYIKYVMVILLVFGVAVGSVMPSKAAPSYPYYTEPTLTNLMQAMVRFGAISIYDDKYLDAYERIADCPNFAKNYDDQFKWEKHRQFVRDMFEKKKHALPVAFKYETKMALDRYDFKNKRFPFYKESGQNTAVNTFIVDASSGKGCLSFQDNFIPLRYKFILSEPVELEGLYLDEGTAKALFARMESAGNEAHIVYPRFNMRVKYIATLVPRDEYKKEKRKATLVSKMKADNSDIGARLDIIQSIGFKSYATFNMELDSIEYYEDKKREKLIYTYRP